MISAAACSEIAGGVMLAFGLFTGIAAGSLDAPLRLTSWTTLLFGATVLFGLFGVWASTRPDVVRVTHVTSDAEARRRRAA